MAHDTKIVQLNSDRRHEGVKYLDLDEPEFLDVNPPVQLLKELLADPTKK